MSSAFLFSNHDKNKAQAQLSRIHGPWEDIIRPEVKNDLRTVQKHWQELRSPSIDKVQGWMYDIFLKANNIPSGTKNYSEVVQLLISLKPLS